MLERINTTLGCLLILTCVFLANKVYHYHLEKSLRDYVSWCVSDDPSAYCHYNRKCIWKLRDYICNLQKHMRLGAEYRITEKSEKDIVCEIITAYQQDLIQSYFQNLLSLNRKIAKISSEEFFVITLVEFLRKNECEKEFNGKDMYITKSYKSYPSRGMLPPFDAVYELTDYAVIYHKIYYIAELFLEENKHLYNIIHFYPNPDEIKKVIDTREIKVSRF